MMIEHITDPPARGVARLIERYRKPVASALLASWLGEVQALEDALWDLLVLRSVGNAVGAALDVLGRIVGQPRQGRIDDVYRLWVAARVLVNRSSGQTKQLIAIVKKLTDDAHVKLEEYYPAAFMLRVADGMDADTGTQIAKLLALAKGVGISMHFVWFPSVTGSAFAFAPSVTSVLDSPAGFGAGAFAAVSDGMADITFYMPPLVPEDALTDDDGEPLTHDDDYLLDE